MVKFVEKGGESGEDFGRCLGRGKPEKEKDS